MALGAANIWGKASKEASLGCALEGQGGGTEPSASTPRSSRGLHLAEPTPCKRNKTPCNPMGLHKTPLMCTPWGAAFGESFIPSPSPQGAGQDGAFSIPLEGGWYLFPRGDHSDGQPGTGI